MESMSESETWVMEKRDTGAGETVKRENWRGSTCLGAGSSAGTEGSGSAGVPDSEDISDGFTGMSGKSSSHSKPPPVMQSEGAGAEPAMQGGSPARPHRHPIAPTAPLLSSEALPSEESSEALSLSVGLAGLVGLVGLPLAGGCPEGSGASGKLCSPSSRVGLSCEGGDAGGSLVASPGLKAPPRRAHHRAPSPGSALTWSKR